MATAIEDTLNQALKDAMRARNNDRVACIRQLKSKVQETVNAKDFAGAVDDALYHRVIAGYIKSLQKGIEELGAAGDKGAALRSRYQAEIDYLQQYLPQTLGEADTRALVQQALGALGGSKDPKQAGRVMGAIMKDNKGRVDAALVKRLVDETLR